MQTFLENYLVPLIFLVIATFSGFGIWKHMKIKKENEQKEMPASETKETVGPAEEKEPEGE